MELGKAVDSPDITRGNKSHSQSSPKIHSIISMARRNGMSCSDWNYHDFDMRKANIGTKGREEEGRTSAHEIFFFAVHILGEIAVKKLALQRTRFAVSCRD